MGDDGYMNFNLPNSYGRFRPWGLLSLGSRASVRKADNFIAICEPIVYTMWNQ
jgi:hypothetical protein